MCIIDQSDPIKQLMRAEIKEIVLSGEGKYCQAFKAQGLYHSSVDKINELNQQVGMQRYNLINSIFRGSYNDAYIATAYKTWEETLHPPPGSLPPNKRSKSAGGLKERFFEALKQAIDEENTRRLQSGNDRMKIDR